MQWLISQSNSRWFGSCLCKMCTMKCKFLPDPEKGRRDSVMPVSQKELLIVGSS
jgi:hypothetical protein